ncbi:MAG: CDP-glycerol glycerophosphotransferase family protein [Actinomycetota bacterium]|nr:CDP-glycerol glycerophosphotransferase family protein [Actinomycetota bacterium]
MDLLEELHKSGCYDLVVDKPVAQALSSRSIPHEILDSYIGQKATYWVDKTMRTLEKRLPEVFGKEAFRQQFNFDGQPVFDEIVQPLFNNLMGQFAEEIFLVEVLRNLFNKRDVSLLLVWTDVIRYTKTATRAAQARKIPVLQLLHGGWQSRFIGHFENQIYADKIANMAPFSKDFFEFYQRDTSKCVVTGRVEFDYTAASQKMSRAEACSRLGLDHEQPIIVFGTTHHFPHTLWYRDYHDSVGQTFAAFLQAFGKLRKEHPKLQLLVKVHPSAPAPVSNAFFQERAAAAGISDALVTTQHLQEAMHACDVLVSFGSTICIDALLLDKPVVILDLQARSDCYVYKDDAFAFVRNPEDIYETVKAALFDKKFQADMEKKRERSKYYYNYLNDGKAMERVISLIDEMAQ